jgi:membrane protein DedA with SNARE-associated domain
VTSLQLTYGGVLLAVFANQICLPIPAVVFLVPAGALSAHGRMSASIVVFLGVLGCLAGDGIGFWLGRKWGSRAMRLVCRFSPDPRSSSKKARKVSPLWSLDIVRVQVHSRTGRRHAPT